MAERAETYVGSWHDADEATRRQHSQDIVEVIELTEEMKYALAAADHDREIKGTWYVPTLPEEPIAPSVSPVEPLHGEWK